MNRNNQFQSIGVRDNLIRDSQINTTLCWDPSSAHEPITRPSGYHKRRHGVKSLKSLASIVLSRYREQLTAIKLQHGTFETWREVWEEICYNGWDSFEVFVQFARVFKISGQKNDFRCCYVGSKAEQLVTGRRSRHRSHRPELLDATSIVNQLFVRKLAQQLNTLSIPVRVMHNPGRCTFLVTMDLSKMRIGNSADERRVIISSIAELPSLAALRIDAGQLDGYGAQMWATSLRLGYKWKKLRLLSIEESCSEATSDVDKVNNNRAGCVGFRQSVVEPLINLGSLRKFVLELDHAPHAPSVPYLRRWTKRSLDSTMLHALKLIGSKPRNVVVSLRTHRRSCSPILNTQPATWLILPENVARLSSQSH